MCLCFSVPWPLFSFSFTVNADDLFHVYFRIVFFYRVLWGSMYFAEGRLAMRERRRGKKAFPTDEMPRPFDPTAPHPPPPTLGNTKKCHYCICHLRPGQKQPNPFWKKVT